MAEVFGERLHHHSLIDASLVSSPPVCLALSCKFTETTCRPDKQNVFIFLNAFIKQNIFKKEQCFCLSESSPTAVLILYHFNTNILSLVCHTGPLDKLLHYRVCACVKDTYTSESGKQEVVCIIPFPGLNFFSPGRKIKK